MELTTEQKRMILEAAGIVSDYQDDCGDDARWEYLGKVVALLESIGS